DMFDNQFFSLYGMLQPYFLPIGPLGGSTPFICVNTALAKWVLFTSSGISSGLYHACDVGTCTFLYLATIDEVFKRAIHTVIAILTTLLAATNAT
ncbi:hypothetical protein S245_020455, partial [Arachis hypogaea]